MQKLQKLKAIYSYVKYMGMEWFLFRIRYEFRKRTGYFDRLNREILKTVASTKKELFFYHPIGLINPAFQKESTFIQKADEALEGKIFAFSHLFLDYSKERQIAWHTNPITKIKASNRLSWNRLPDFGEYGDIKLIWEASRFSHVFYFIHAYAITQKRHYAKRLVMQILHWISNNSYPNGVHYKCGQEIGFRVFAWVIAMEYFGDFFFQKSKAFMIKNIYTSLLRIEANIDYSAKSVKNNHSISESVGLWIGGMLFEQFKESERWREKGMSSLLEESTYQIYNDGSYIQHSFTYQRLVLDLLSLVSVIAKKKEVDLPMTLRTRHQKMMKFLSAFVQPNGWLPNYGSNDGVNLFPLSGDDYRDFRSSLNFASILNSGKQLFEGHTAIADFFGLTSAGVMEIETKRAFEDGGYYILKNENIFAFIRCHTYRHRPAQNDMFHLDVWYKGENIFCDTGSFSYNTNKAFKEHFTGVKGHNTIGINGANQMESALNFGYTNWTQALCSAFDEAHFLGENYAYHKQFGIVHNRDIMLNKEQIVVNDRLSSIVKMTSVEQYWNTLHEVVEIDDRSVRVGRCVLSSTVAYRIEESYISDYYNSYKIGKRIVFVCESESDVVITTTMEFEE